MFMLAVGFGLFLGTIIITIVTNFKRYNEEKKKADQTERQQILLTMGFIEGSMQRYRNTRHNKTSIKKDVKGKK